MILGMGLQLQAQTSTPLLAGRNDSPRVGGESINASSKYQIANAVYKKLVAARGDARYPAPRFVMSRATSDGALMSYDSLKITLEERAYDVCASFGEQRDQALAIILGHELIHYYEKHGWRLGFANEYRQLDIGVKLDELQDKVTNETQADYLGGFLAYSAGFGLFDKVPDLIGGLYKAYQLPDTLPLYPSLQDRQAMSRFTLQKLELLVDAFEVANLMVAVGNYSQAREYYQFVLRDYQSRELFNNIGVSALLEVLDKSESKMVYPVQLDLNSRAGRGGDGFAQKRSELLTLAIQSFDAAIHLDPEYAPAYLNKACAYALLEDAQRARFYAETEAKQRAEKAGNLKTVGDVQVLLGILAYTKGDSITARQIFEKEAANKNAIADKNLRTLLRKPDEPEELSLSGLSSRSENIDSISLSSFSQNPDWDKKRTQVLDGKTKLFQHIPKGNNSKVYICRYEGPDDAVLSFFQITKPGYTGKTAKNLGIGATRDEILAAYKKPQRSIATPTGEIMVYKRQMFILDGEGKLLRWVNYLLP